MPMQCNRAYPELAQLLEVRCQLYRIMDDLEEGSDVR